MTCDSFAAYVGITSTPNCDSSKSTESPQIADMVRHLGGLGCCGSSTKTACGEATNGGGEDESSECKAADDIVSKDSKELTTDTAHIAQCYDADSSSDPEAKDQDKQDFTKWIFKKGKGSCSVCSAALKIKFGSKCDNKNGDCKHCPFIIDAYKDCDVAPKFAIAHTIALEGISAAAFNEDPKIIASFQSTVATTLGVTTDKIINIKAKSSERNVGHVIPMRFPMESN